MTSLSVILKCRGPCADIMTRLIGHPLLGGDMRKFAEDKETSAILDWCAAMPDEASDRGLCFRNDPATPPESIGANADDVKASANLSRVFETGKTKRLIVLPFDEIVLLYVFAFLRYWSTSMRVVRRRKFIVISYT